MFFAKKFAYMGKKQYFCIVFFMVLDLRLIKVGLSGDNPLFFSVCCSVEKIGYSATNTLSPPLTMRM